MGAFAQNPYLITGCSGGGKSTLLAELANRGLAIVPEAGRRVVAAEQAAGGTALPWTDLYAFLHKVEILAKQDLLAAAELDGPAFFDRGLVDTFCGFERLDEGDAQQLHGQHLLYDQCVFVAPPWPEIYETDEVRQHGFDEARTEYEHILTTLPKLGYQPVHLPLVSVEERADFVIKTIGGAAD